MSNDSLTSNGPAPAAIAWGFQRGPVTRIDGYIKGFFSISSEYTSHLKTVFLLIFALIFARVRINNLTVLKNIKDKKARGISHKSSISKRFSLFLIYQ